MGAELDPSQKGNKGRKHPRKRLRGGVIQGGMGVGVGWGGGRPHQERTVWGHHKELTNTQKLDPGRGPTGGTIGLMGQTQGTSV